MFSLFSHFRLKISHQHELDINLHGFGFGYLCFNQDLGRHHTNYTVSSRISIKEQDVKPV